ncbi:MAG: inorganic phosphate transporter [Candidatus Schekmanbacteria bacterium]|nr:inorganic phosphate transporter [Candidatus Schekmanbacteria bacterium]
MDSSEVAFLAIATIGFVLVFNYTNGFHDAANIIGTTIASRAMTPIQSIIIVGMCELLGPLLGGTAVANTIGGVLTIGDLPPSVSIGVILCGIVGAISWNLLTWWFGIPSSSLHALVGGLCGAVIVAAGWDHVVWGLQELRGYKLVGVMKVLLALVLSPLVGFWVGFAIHRFLSFLLRGARPSVNKPLRGLQFITAAGLAFSHGANDAQKSMGIITLVLLLSGRQSRFEVPTWVMLACASAITLGVLSGGWRIVRTVGFGIYKVRPIHALGAQLTSAAVILSASALGAPVSTTHVVSASIMGIGASERPKAVRWARAKDIASTWVITMPAAAIVAIATYFAVLRAALGL